MSLFEIINLILSGITLVGILGIGVAWGRLTQKVDSILMQTTRTNGRVSALEKGHADCQNEMEHRLTAVETRQEAKNGF